MSDQPTDPQHPPQDPPPPPAQPGPPPHGGYAGYPQPPAQGYPPQGGYPAQGGYPPQGGGYPQAGPQGYGPGYPQPRREPSTLGGLTDLGFTRRITPALARLVYLAVIALAALVTILGLLGAIGAFSTAGNMFVSSGTWVLNGFVLLIGAPLGSFVMVAFARFWLEYLLDRASSTSGS